MGEDDGLDFLGTLVTDFKTGFLVQLLEFILVSVDGDVTSRVQFDGVLSVDDGDNLLSLATLVGGDGDLGFFVAIGHQNVWALVDGVVVVGAIVSVDGIGSNVAPGLGDTT